MTDTERLLEAGEQVLLIDSKDRRYLVTLATGKQWHSHSGVLDHDVLIGQPEGVTVVTTGGAKVLAFRPTLEDFVRSDNSAHRLREKLGTRVTRGARGVLGGSVERFPSLGA